MAAFVEGKIREAQKSTRSPDTQAVAVLTALQIAEELFRERDRRVELKTKRAKDSRKEPVPA